MKLATAAVFAIHVADRLRAMVRGTVESEVLEAGLIMVVLLSILAVAPALWSQNVELARDLTIQLLLAGLAAALVIIERSYANAAEPEAAEAKAGAPRSANWFSPWR
jgi:hypothetical protein